MRQQMGVTAPNYGPLLDDMLLRDGAVVAGFLHPRVEPEIAVVLARDLSGAGLSLDEVARAVGEVRACLEVVDSIWLDYRFTAAQNTADGSSAAGVVLGQVLALRRFGHVTDIAEAVSFLNVATGRVDHRPDPRRRRRIRAVIAPNRTAEGRRCGFGGLSQLPLRPCWRA